MYSGWGLVVTTGVSGMKIVASCFGRALLKNTLPDTYIFTRYVFTSILFTYVHA